MKNNIEKDNQCKNCGRILAEKNYKKRLCDCCQEKYKKHMKIAIIIISLILLLFMGFYFCFKYSAHHTISYKENQVKILDKKEEISYLFTGKSMLRTSEYYLILEDNASIKVSHYIYNKYQIGDYIQVIYTYIDNIVIDITCKN